MTVIKSRSALIRLFLLPLAALFLLGNSIDQQVAQLGQEGKYEEAYTLTAAAAETGDPVALDLLAQFYDEGLVVEQDQGRAAELYRAAADGGVPHAQWRLGVMIDIGQTEGATEEAVELFKQAAAQGFVDAMTSLAVMYATGHGVETDYDASRFYYSMGAAKGNSHAIQGLGILSLLGQGVAEDPVEAAAYFLVSAALGNDTGRANLNRVISDFNEGQRDRMIARAHELAEQFGVEIKVAAD